MAKYGITNEQRCVFNLILYDNDYCCLHNVPLSSDATF